MTVLSTGIEVLDRKMDGGIPAGRVVALEAHPASQSELFLYEMASARQTYYLTTERTVADIRGSLETVGVPAETVEIHAVQSIGPFAAARDVLAGIEAESTVILDPMRRLEERQAGVYRSFLNDLRRRTAETGSLTLLHCLDGRETPPQRDRTEYLADIIFDLSTEVRGGSIENRLLIPKFRGGQSLGEAINLDLSADVTVDVSRKIA